jgi:hypothetical protein
MFRRSIFPLFAVPVLFLLFSLLTVSPARATEDPLDEIDDGRTTGGIVLGGSGDQQASDTPVPDLFTGSRRPAGHCLRQGQRRQLVDCLP